MAEEPRPPPDPDRKTLVDAAGEIALTIQAGDFAPFETTWLVDKKRYLHYYKKRYKVEVADRGWREFVDGLKANFEKKNKTMGEAKLTVKKVEFDSDRKFKTCQIWADFKGKKPEKEGVVGGDLILQFVKVWGKWKVTSLE